MAIICVEAATLMVMQYGLLLLGAFSIFMSVFVIILLLKIIEKNNSKKK